MQTQIEHLNSIVCNCNATNDNKKSSNKITNVTENNAAQYSSLEQNIPNPFTQNTRINFYIAENAKTTVLYIYNMQGHQIDSHEIYQTGSGNISISGNTMQAGMYLYTLIVDKQEVDTKKMILTE
jgi:hypothetical protein